MDKTELKQGLIDTIITKLTERGDTDINISNIRIYTGEYGIDALADVSLIWQLNGHKKHAIHKDYIFVYRNGEWHSPIFWF